MTDVCYSGTYQAVCLGMKDDLARVQIPQIFSTEVIPIRSFAGPRPKSGDVGWVMFEHGMAEYPVWAGSESWTETPIPNEVQIATAAPTVTAGAPELWVDNSGVPLLRHWTGSAWVPVLGVPSGGTVNQIIVKQSAADGAVAWSSKAIPAGGGAGWALVKNTATDYDIGWKNPKLVDAWYGRVDVMASAVGAVDQNLPNVNATYAGWAEVTLGSLYFGFGGSNINGGSTACIYSNQATGDDGAALQVYTPGLTSATGGAWARGNQNISFIFPVAASGVYGIVFRGTHVGPSTNCYWRAHVSMKLYAN